MIDPQTRVEELVTKLRKNGHRITPQRMAVIKTLVSSAEHPSAEQIYDRVKVDFPMTSIATIYKTVAVLKEMGELIELSFPNTGNRYDCCNPLPHPHIICTQCGKIIDVDYENISDLPHQIAKRTGYQITDHRLDFFGICPRCQVNEAQSAVPKGGGTARAG